MVVNKTATPAKSRLHSAGGDCDWRWCWCWAWRILLSGPRGEAAAARASAADRGGARLTCHGFLQADRRRDEGPRELPEAAAWWRLPATFRTRVTASLKTGGDQLRLLRRVRPGGVARAGPHREHEDRRSWRRSETKPFRLPFDNIPESWNQTMPQLVMARIEFQ